MITVCLDRDSISTGIRLSTFEITVPTYMVVEFTAVRQLCVSRRPYTRPEALINHAETYSALPDLGIISNMFTEKLFEKIWREARGKALSVARGLIQHEGTEYKVVECLVHPYSMTNLVITSTQWSSALDQLSHTETYQMDRLIRLIRQELVKSVPTRLSPGDWHLPMLTPEDADAALWHVVNDQGIGVLLTESVDDRCLHLLRQVSVSRCVHIPTWTKDPVERITNDLKVFHGSKPANVSRRPDAYDHQATPDEVIEAGWRNRELHGPLTGWCQYRQIAKWEQWRDHPIPDQQTKEPTYA